MNVMVVVRAYIEGVEISQIPELSEVCAMNDWIKPLLDWCRDNRPDLKMDAIFFYGFSGSCFV